MKSIVVLAALVALALADPTTESHFNTTSHNGTSTTGPHNATSSGNGTSSSTTSAPVGSTTGVLPPVTYTAITTIWAAGADANRSNACVNASDSFTAVFTTGQCAFYPIHVPGFNASVRVYWNGETSATMTLWLLPTDVPTCEGTPVAAASFTNGGCDFIEVPVSPFATIKVWVTSRWGSLLTTGTTGSTTTTTTTTGDAGAGSTIVPSFVAMLFATLLLVARFF
jgi:hypothetical protein